MKNITISSIDYYTWKFGALILFFLLLFIFWYYNHNDYATPAGYINAFIQSEDKGLCQVRFSAACKPNIIVCESDINNKIDVLTGENEDDR